MNCHAQMASRKVPFPRNNTQRLQENKAMQHDFNAVIDRSGTYSAKWNTYPKGVIPMWVADTDFKSPQPVIDAIVKRAGHGIFGYSADGGDFARATQSWLQRRFAWNIETDWVRFVPSLGVGLGSIIRALTSPGDNVLVQTPIYPPFLAVPANNERVPLANPLVWRDGAYHIDFADLEKKLAEPKTTLMMLCNPHNPTGRSFSCEELTRMGELCRKHSVFILADEIHSDFVYTGKHITFPSLSPELAAISVVCINPSKTFNIADMRIAALIAPDEEVRKKITKDLTACKFGMCSLSLAAYCSAYTECDYYADQAKNYMRENAEYAVAYFAEKISAISTYKPEATFLLWLDCRKLGLSQPELEALFTEKALVACNSGADFGKKEGTGFMRLNLGCPRSVLQEALRRIEKAVKKLGS